MELSEAVALKLISEIKKPGRECLYDMSNRSYKNNHIKQNVWSEVAEVVGISRNECQTHWKSLRRRHKTVINKSSGRSGSERLEIKGFSKLLLEEMDYFLKFTEDKEPSVTNYSTQNTESFQNLFDEMACDPDINESSSDFCELPSGSYSSSSTPLNKKCSRPKKRVKLDEAEDEYKASIESLNNLTAAVLEASTSKRDPFFLALEDEFAKVPEDHKSALKLKLMSLVIENQK